jgi:hypothetical protein
MRELRIPRWSAVGALALSAVIALTPAGATSHLVLPDGTGDFPTIQAAVDHAVDGDEVLLGDGVFRGEGNRDIDCNREITIRSAHGDPAHCVIDCEGSAEEPHHAILLYGAALVGVTVTGSFGGSAAVLIRLGGIVSRCVFLENHGGGSGGAVNCDLTYPPTIVTECTFIRNSAELGGGAFI